MNIGNNTERVEFRESLSDNIYSRMVRLETGSQYITPFDEFGMPAVFSEHFLYG
jgi:hypothetical protein